jgi:hypothetical protein
MSGVSSRAGAAPPQRQHQGMPNGQRMADYGGRLRWQTIAAEARLFNRCRAKMSHNPAPHVTDDKDPNQRMLGRKCLARDAY